MKKNNLTGLNELVRRIPAMQDDSDALLQRMTQRLAQIFLREVKRRTPVGVKPTPEKKAVQKRGTGKKRKKFLADYWKGYQGGALRRSWAIHAVRKAGGVWVATIINPMEYASYVEYGHRQQPGRYVPAIGRRLKNSWTPGRFMMTLSAEFIETDGAAYIQREFERYLRRCWLGK